MVIIPRELCELAEILKFYYINFEIGKKSMFRIIPVDYHLIPNIAMRFQMQGLEFEFDGVGTQIT